MPTSAITRRDALKLAASAAVSFILPAPRRHIDLMAFCARTDGTKYDMRLPYEADDFTYATDGRVCVRTRPESADKIQRSGPVPPFGTLSWNHDRLRGWRPLPALRPILAAHSECSQCDGTGYRPGVVVTDCERCSGSGSEWVGSRWDISYPVTCRACKGRGHFAPCEECSACHGNAIGVFPDLVQLGDAHFSAAMYAKAQRLGGEYFLDNWNAMPSHPMLRFRFDGGLGLLMGVERKAAESRIREAANRV